LLLAALVCTTLIHAHGDHDHDHHDHEEEGDDSPSEVAVLTAENFDDHIKTQEITLVEFYAPWCGHCKALAPEYDRASILLSGQASLAKVDCTEFRELCSKYDVQGFPTVKLFRNDGSPPADYDQARKSDAIVKFMQKQKQAAYETLKDKKELDALTAKDGIAVVAFLGSGDSAANDAFVAVARALRNDYDFALTTESALTHGQTTPAVTMFRSFDEPEISFTGEFTQDALTTWIRNNAFPVFGEIGPENYQKYLERGLPLTWFFLNKESDQELNKIAEEVAKDFKSELSFVWLDGVRWADHAKTFGLNGATPGVVIEDRENRKNYVLPQADAVTAASLRAHCTAFVAGTLQPTVKSEPIPASNDGPVTIVVGKSFDSIVLDTSKDVLVEFYAPWCGHCKSLAPKYEKLGELFADTDSIVIAKVDATENDTPAEIKGFPTLIFYPSNDKANPITYDGDRTEQAMAKWIREKAPTLKKKKAGAPGAASTASHDEL